MADLFCSFLDFQSLSTNFKFHLFLPPKHYCSSALVHSHSSRINGMRRRPLHLTLFSRPSSPNFDVISTHGTKPGVYAREFMKNCEKFIADHNGYSLNNPMELLNLSVAETHHPGPSTVLIAQLVGQDLHVANVGDSGFIVLRHGAVYKRSSPMLHAFHFTKQIERGDDPSHLAELYRVDLDEDDVIITATDGLLDNLYDEEISSIVVNSLGADKKLEEIAELLATKAQEIGRSTSGRSPFADEAQAAGFAGYTGGKLDDVAVIVSIVQRQSTPQTS
ncbi:UNVERIFIED_CONTAM: putative protein phosphatase 2C 71 [Sesamum radiatum]|uniref:Protein phosphatase n=1 Tax=Sesamum radiatum TaxID=300843 RepID=A0AAW2RWG0_SESRA